MPKVSVIVPVYNVEKYIKKCIFSLKNQTYKDIEFIIVDDGSQDNSLSYIYEIVDSDERFQIFTQKNQGQSYARAFGISKARGDYVGFVDGDDFVEPDIYERLLINLERENADCSIIGYDLVFEKNSKHISVSNEKKYFVMNNKELTNEWISQRTFKGFLWDKLFKKELFDKIQLIYAFGFMEDVAVINQMIPKIQKSVYDGKNRYNYLQRKNSAVSQKYKDEDFNAVNVVLEMNKLVTVESQKNLVKERLCQIVIALLARQPNHKQAKKILESWKREIKLKDIIKVSKSSGRAILYFLLYLGVPYRMVFFLKKPLSILKRKAKKA